MAETRAANNLYTEEELFDFLVDKDYQGLIRAIVKDYQEQFTSEQSGEAFEDCVNWCARNAGGLESAKQVLLELFERFYTQLPAAVRNNLAYLAEEIGYKPPQHNIVQFEHRATGQGAPARKAITAMVKQIQDYVAEVCGPRESKVSLRFRRAIGVPAMITRRTSRSS
jgi:hypothetical protein